MTQTPETSVPERTILLLIAAVHFINILDFMIVMPLGPEFARHLGIPTSALGIVAGSYTAAAALSGIAGSFFLDRFDRRVALAVSMAGLILGTAAGGLAQDLPTLIAARVAAGLFGGPATSISLAIIGDIVPPQRRGRALSRVFAAFSVASIAGVPVSLEIANAAGWRAPFFAVAALGAVVVAIAMKVMPPLRLHLQRGDKPPGLRAMARTFTRPLPLLAYGGTAAMMTSAFAIIPSIPPYLEFNLGYTGEGWIAGALEALGTSYRPSVLGPLYFLGGLVSLGVLAAVGRLTDRLGSTLVSWIGAALVIAVAYIGFIDYQPWLPVLALFVGWMGSMSVRGVPARTLDTKIPAPPERAGFMSAQSAVQHLSLAAVTGLSSLVLHENPDHSLVGLPIMGVVSVAFALVLPACVTLAEAALRRRDGGEEKLNSPAASR